MTRITSHELVIDGLRTHYLEAGDPGNPTFLLIHDGGFGGSAELCWSAMIPDLAQTHHVIAPDLLGWGRSAKVVHFGESPYPSKIRHVARLVETLDLRDVTAVGTSFGGSLVLRATIDEHDPWRIRTAVSITGAGGLYRIPEGVEALATFEPTIEDARRLTSWLVDDAEAFEDHARGRLANSLIPGHYEAMNAPRLKNPALERPTLNDPFPEALRDLDIPVLFVEGARDRLLEPGWAEKLALLTPRGEAMVLDCGHEPNIETPDALAKVLVEFAQDGEG